jgi:MFS family permease
MPQEITRLRDLSKQQVHSGLAAWLGWMFDGLDMHLYTLVAQPFVTTLLGFSLASTLTLAERNSVDTKSSIIQAAFLVGWAFGGAVFGRVGDMLGRRKVLLLTILTYACFTGLSALAQTWWQLMIFRFMAALGIGGEWAVGASLLVETWPKSWRPWIAATLQCAVNVGVLLAIFASTFFEKDSSHRLIFLVGIAPALVTLWIRRAVPETEEWESAKGKAPAPRIRELFGPGVWSVTWRTMLICGVSLTAHWAFLFWQQSHIRHLPEVLALSDEKKNHAVGVALYYVMIGSLIGNYLCGGLAKLLGYRYAISLSLGLYFVLMCGAFHWQWSYNATLWWWAAIGAVQGVFGLFTMCLPPLFPTLLRTTGAGFCYNFGRIIAAAGTVYFGLTKAGQVGDYARSLFYASFLFIPAAFIALLLPEEKEESAAEVNVLAD